MKWLKEMETYHRRSAAALLKDARLLRALEAA
jgi:hypothetical protein